MDFVVADAFYKPISDLIANKKWKGRITEFVINGPKNAGVRIAGKGWHRLTGKEWPTLNEIDEDWMFQLCNFLAAKHGITFSKDFPLVACRTPDGNRFMGGCGTIVDSRFFCAIRVFREIEVEYKDYACSENLGALITKSVVEGENIVTLGGTNSGKTTFNNMLNKFIEPDMRMVTIEDTRELNFPSLWNKIHLLTARTQSETKVGDQELLDVATRVNPDELHLGEVSIRNAMSLQQAMDLGEMGLRTTMHANNPLQGIDGLVRRVILSGGAESSAIDMMRDFMLHNIGKIIQLNLIMVGRGDERREVRKVTSVLDLAEIRNRYYDRGGEDGHDYTLYGAVQRAMFVPNKGDDVLKNDYIGADEQALKSGLRRQAAKAMPLDPEEKTLIKATVQGHIADPELAEINPEAIRVNYGVLKGKKENIDLEKERPTSPLSAVGHEYKFATERIEHLSRENALMAAFMAQKGLMDEYRAFTGN